MEGIILLSRSILLLNDPLQGQFVYFHFVLTALVSILFLTFDLILRFVKSLIRALSSLDLSLTFDIFEVGQRLLMHIQIFPDHLIANVLLYLDNLELIL